MAQLVSQAHILVSARHTCGFEYCNQVTAFGKKTLVFFNISLMGTQLRHLDKSGSYDNAKTTEA